MGNQNQKEYNEKSHVVTNEELVQFVGKFVEVEYFESSGCRRKGSSMSDPVTDIDEEFTNIIVYDSEKKDNILYIINTYDSSNKKNAFGKTTSMILTEKKEVFGYFFYSTVLTKYILNIDYENKETISIESNKPFHIFFGDQTQTILRNRPTDTHHVYIPEY